MKKSLEQQQKEMDEKWKMFEKEKHAWEESTGYSNSLENVKELVQFFSFIHDSFIQTFYLIHVPFILVFFSRTSINLVPFFFLQFSKST